MGVVYRNIQHRKKRQIVEKLSQAHVETWKVWVQLFAPHVLSSGGHEAAPESVGEEGREGPVDSEAPGPGQGGGHQGHQQVESDPQRQASHSTKVSPGKMYN